MSAAELNHLEALFRPHLLAVALCAARLLPVALLCPLFGGGAAPTTVRLSWTLATACGLHFAGGVEAPAESSLWGLVGLAVGQVLLGTAMGLIAALPFDAARMGGRFVDLFRGASAEAALPSSGTREAATGDLLYQLLVALSVASLGLPLVLGALWKSFKVIPLAPVVLSEDQAMWVVKAAGGAMATGLAIGAPVAGATLAVDCFLAFASRAAPGWNLQESGAPVRLLAGAAALWLGLGALCERLLAAVLASELQVEVLLRGGP